MTPPVPPVGHYDAQYGHFASRLLDIACGAGGPTLRIAARACCTVVGGDVHEQAIAAARAHAEQEGLAARAAFDGLICVDAVNHLPES